MSFVLHLIGKGLSPTAIAGKLSGLSYYGKTYLGYSPAQSELLRRTLSGWGREWGSISLVIDAKMFELLQNVLESLPKCCYDLF